MAQNKFEMKIRQDDDSFVCEITNGSICLCVNDDGEEEDMQAIVDALNKPNVKWYSNNKLELDQHIEIMQLQDKLLELEQWQQEAIDTWGPLMDWGQGRKDIPLGSSITQGILRRLNKAQKLVDALEKIRSLCNANSSTIWNVATSALSSWNEGKEGKV